MRVLLYAPVDLNLIDGSAVWCASIAQMLSHDADVRVDILLHTPLKCTLSADAFADRPGIRLLDPWKPGEHPALRASRGKPGPRLTPAQAFERIERLHTAELYDLLVLRGGSICQLVAAAPHLAARAWFYLTQHDANFEIIAAISHSNGRIACQTPLIQELLEGMLGPDPERYVPLPPMVPRLLCDRPRTASTGRRLCYVGKFDPDYLVEEMIGAFCDMRQRFADAEFIIAGDKFHDPQRTGEFQQRLSALLRSTPGVDWRGGMSRGALGELMTTCDLGSCWRSAHYDDSLELSTKVLEYAAAGLPVLLNPTRVNRLVFGPEYPLYVNTPESFSDRLTAAWEDAGIYRQAAEMAYEACQRFTFAEVNKALRRHLDAYRLPGTRVTAVRRPLRLLFAGHDFKFCREIIDHFGGHPSCVVRLDEWSSHAHHDERQSERLLQWADAVWCEWCLGNAAWYSGRVRPAQRLVIRLHRQEMTTHYPDDVVWSNVDHLIFIAPHVQKAMLERLGSDVVRDARLIYNTFACERFARGQAAGAEFRLGMLGYCPKLKNPLLAVEILQRLLEDDQRWQFVLTGHRPESYAWLSERAEERAYYERFEKALAPLELAGHVIRQDWSEDPPAWYSAIGFILSCSDLEGSHQTVAEGMAAGCVPVVHRWHGAEEMYPNALLFGTADEAAALICACSDPNTRAQHREHARREVRERFDTSVILPKLEPLLLGRAPAPERQKTLATAAG